MIITNYKLRITNSQGYITLLSVLVVGAVGVAISLSLITLGLGSGRTSLAYQQMHQAKALASACAEEGLQKVRELTDFVGNGNLSFGAGVCSYSVTSQGGENRTVDTTGTVGTILRKTKVIVTAINPLITVSSWQEVP